MQSSQINGVAERLAGDAALEAHVTAIMDAVAIADDPAALRATVRRQLVALTGLIEGSPQSAFEGLKASVKALLLTGAVDHTYTDEGPEPSVALTALREVSDLVRCARELDDLSYSGATLATVLLSRPWLQAFDIEVESQGNMGDEGGFFTSYDVDADNLVVCSGIEEVPEDLQDDDGELDIPMAVAEIASELENDAPALAGAVGLTEGGDETLTFTVERSALQDLFDVAAATATPVSGIAVAQRLWPEMMVKVTNGLKSLDGVAT